MIAIAFVDGRGNCDTGSCAVYLKLDSGRIVEEARFLGEVTNNVAEYEGVLLAFRTAKENLVTHLEINSDSKLIVHQIEDKWRITNPVLQGLRDRVWSEAHFLERVSIKWVPRTQNTRADKLCREISSGGLSRISQTS